MTSSGSVSSRRSRARCSARLSRATSRAPRALKESLAEAMGKFSPDRTVLPIPDPNFGGTVGRTLDASVADWTINMTPSPPEGAPNVLLVLIDDAGFGNPSTFGGPVSTPNMTRVGEQGLTYNRFHVTALCSPSRAALLTGRNHHTVGFGSIGELPGPFPGYTASVPKDCAPFVRALQGNGYSTGGFGKWHLTPDHVQGAAGPFDRWPNAWGFDHFWGIPRRRGGSVRPRDHAGQHDARRPGGRGRQASTTARRPDRPGGEVAAHRPGAGPDETVVHLLLDRVLARPASGGDGVEREVPRQVRPGLGRAARGDLRTAEEAGRDPARRGAHAETGRVPGVGLALGQREAALRAPDGGLRRLPGERRLERWTAARRGRGDGRARQHARDLHLRRQRREPGGHDHRLVQRADDAERDRADARAAALADRPVRRA